MIVAVSWKGPEPETCHIRRSAHGGAGAEHRVGAVERKLARLGVGAPKRDGPGDPRGRGGRDVPGARGRVRRRCDGDRYGGGERRVDAVIHGIGERVRSARAHQRGIGHDRTVLEGTGARAGLVLEAVHGRSGGKRRVGSVEGELTRLGIRSSEGDRGGHSDGGGGGDVLGGGRCVGGRDLDRHRGGVGSVGAVVHGVGERVGPLYPTGAVYVIVAVSWKGPEPVQAASDSPVTVAPEPSIVSGDRRSARISPHRYRRA